MINIVIFCNPNYENKNIINTIKRNIDVVSQFLNLYYSIKKNWKSFEYKISLFHNKDIKFNNIDKKRLSNVEVDIFECEPDNENIPFYCRCATLELPLKETGTHRLVLDCDMIALNNPTFNLECDWQAMFAGNIIESKYYNMINTRFNYNIDLTEFQDNMYYKYNNEINVNHRKLFPHFNGGAILIKESLCKKFVDLWKPSLVLSYDNNLPLNINHIGIQYSMSFALINLSDNWEPFKPGFNYIIKLNNNVKENKISLVHYCGVNGFEIALEKYKKYFIYK